METTNKNQLRKTYLEKRDRLTPEARARASATIRQQLFRQSAWGDSHTIFSYVSFRSEVETHQLIQEALAQKKRVLVPCIDKNLKEVQLSELKQWSYLSAGAYGIPELTARYRMPVDPSEVELALIPGVVFDRQGGRIGMGAGYFDKLLTGMTMSRHVALAYSLQIHPHPIDLEPHDAKMHVIVTEKEVITI